MKIEEQERVLKNDKKNMLVSASAGSGKTYIMIKYITKLICENKIPVRDFLILTFTKAAATEMKERLQKSLKECGNDEFIIEQLDALSTANISTIHSFFEKSLKKYANLLGISENFVVADENFSQKIKQTAFEKSFKKFKKMSPEQYEELIDCYKNDKNRVKDVLFEIENLANAVADREKFLSDNRENCEDYFEKALNFLFENTIENLQENIKEVEKLHVFDFELTLKNALNVVMESKDLIEFAQNLQYFSFPQLPRKKDVGEDVVKILNSIKDDITKTLKKISELNLQDDYVVRNQREGILECQLLNLFEIYIDEEDRLKRSQNCLDFSDLEKYMKILAEKENLFSGIKYVFIDEYQDTNKIQENIIKNVAKNANFVAVGDVKQGIYGFRLASCEIFLKDMEEFSKDENSSVNYLKSNFRSSQKVLDFVNDIFKVCMTNEFTGIDYENGSMLCGMKEFKDDNSKAINIDLICEKEREVASLPKYYSVKEDVIVNEQNDLNQLLDIKNRIFEVMSSQIYEDGKFRSCKYSDIAILSRKRNGLFNNLEMFLQESGIPVVSNSKNVLLDEVEVKVLLNYLKVALNMDDDIALLSVLLSPFGQFNLQQIVDEKNKNEKKLCEIVLEDASGLYVDFKQRLEKFRQNCVFFGIYKAFLILFDECNYKAYVNSKQNFQKVNNFVNKFLSEIVSSDFEFDLAGLINYFETVEITVSSEPSAVSDAVLLTTIHNSKGLEYPIVFLIGCDQSLSKSKPKIDVEINENFGLALKYYDKENNKEICTTKMRAIKEFEAKKDFVEELMIFYVALTRAKNRIYLFVKYNEKCFEKFSLKDCDSYYDLIFYALNEKKDDFLAQGFVNEENIEIRKIENIEEISFENKQNLEMGKIDNKIVEKIENYLNFNYKFDQNLNFRLKESVTGLSQRNDEKDKFSNENFSFASETVDIGNAYHLALKTLDFSKISNLNDLNEEIKANFDIFKDILQFLDLSLLLKNIITIKNVVGDCKVFKEKEFIMKERVCNLLDNVEIDDEIMLQGVVDLFAVGKDKFILIDYKYSGNINEDYLIKKYKNQLKFYKLALQAAFSKNVNEVYLLSLKYNKLIKVEI